MPFEQNENMTGIDNAENSNSPAPASGESVGSGGSPSDSMDEAIERAYGKRGLGKNPEQEPSPKGGPGSEGPGTAAQPSGGDGPSPTKSDTPTERGVSGEPGSDDTGDAAKREAERRIAERRAYNRQQAAMRIARKQEKARIYEQQLARLDKERQSFEAEGSDPTMAKVKEDQIRELQIQRVQELQAEWENEARESFTPEDAEKFLNDSRVYAQWINEKEPELRQYINKPYGRYLLKGWFDKVAKVPEMADKWEQMNSYQKYQQLDKLYNQLQKFGEDFANGKVQVGTNPPQQSQQPQGGSQQPVQQQTPRVQDVPVPGSGRNTSVEPPTDDMGLLIDRAFAKRRNRH